MIEALWFVRDRRDRATDLPEWETLRDRAAELKAHAMGHLAGLLEAFETARDSGGHHGALGARRQGAQPDHL